jgi:hypothetical protein
MTYEEEIQEMEEEIIDPDAPRIHQVEVHTC